MKTKFTCIVIIAIILRLAGNAQTSWQFETIMVNNGGSWFA
ncbi:hypothetical protein [Panacibacter ginsenosidivorans]|nr:hypothetical protein [Panacibacter ginsenosidivorans]